MGRFVAWIHRRSQRRQCSPTPSALSTRPFDDDLLSSLRLPPKTEHLSSPVDIRPSAGHDFLSAATAVSLARALQLGRPSRRRALSTVADQGGAAAASSPFGVLPRVGLGTSMLQERDAVLEAEADAQEAVGRSSGTRAPWAQ